MSEKQTTPPCPRCHGLKAINVRYGQDGKRQYDPCPVCAPTQQSTEVPLEDRAFISGRLFDGRTFRVSRYAWKHRPDDTRFDLFIADQLEVSNAGHEGVIGWLAAELAMSLAPREAPDAG